MAKITYLTFGDFFRRLRKFSPPLQKPKNQPGGANLSKHGDFS
jgi:hypothetical protein